MTPQKIREQAFVASGDADTTIPGVAHAPECEGRTRSPLLVLRAAEEFAGAA